MTVRHGGTLGAGQARLPTEAATEGTPISPDAALVFAGGDPPPTTLRPRLPVDALVIAADSGLTHARALGRHVDLVIGDLDSVDVDELAEARRDGAAVEAHPRDKDQTDLELALDAALARGARDVTVVGGHGGRLDHFAANLTLLAAPRYAAARLDAWMGDAHVVVVRDDVEVTGSPGALLTLVPFGGPVCGIRTTGLRYPLNDEDLDPGTSRAVSNEFTAARARIQVRDGTLLAIAPHALNDPAD
ncbi:MAG TPA: thiamine diphosphokinase [Acidimicrobiia bacterium]|nr:thiamine diphosphokinase [Acidimicrobiia bacterium]